MNQPTQQTIDKLNEIFDRGICAGFGNPKSEVCIEVAIAIACGEPPTDRATCVHPVVRAHSIALNDCSLWSTSKVRADSLREYALNQLGCACIDGTEFAKRLAIQNVKQILPVCLRTLAASPALSAKVKASLNTAISLCEMATDLAAAWAAARSAAWAARAAESAEWAAESAESAESAAWAARAAESAESAARSAEWAARAARAAESAEWAAESAESAARSARSAADTVLALAARVANDVLSSLMSETAGS